MLFCDQYLVPGELKEALSLWANAPTGSRLATGCTDLLPWTRQVNIGELKIPRLIDLSRVKELSEVVTLDGRVWLGSNIVFQQFIEDNDLRHNLPCMPYCAIWFADDQIRRQATLAGNIVNASPAADGTPAALVLNGEMEIARIENDTISRRTVPVEKFILGPGNVDLAPDEIVTAVTCDALPGYGGAFEKVGHRRSLVISTVCTACLVKPDNDGNTFRDVRLAMGGIGPVPVRLRKVETFLIGKKIDFTTIKEAAKMIDGLVQSRTRQTYRKVVVESFIQRALLNALGDCGINVPTQVVQEDAHASS